MLFSFINFLVFNFNERRQDHWWIGNVDLCTQSSQLLSYNVTKFTLFLNWSPILYFFARPLDFQNRVSELYLDMSPACCKVPNCKLITRKNDLSSQLCIRVIFRILLIYHLLQFLELISYSIKGLGAFRSTETVDNTSLPLCCAVRIHTSKKCQVILKPVRYALFSIY